jgi:hypothetical protein
MISSFVRAVGTVALISLAFSPAPAVMAAGINHISRSAMQKASGEHEAKRQKCLSAFNAASASVKARGKKAFMSHCVTNR